MSNRGHTRCCAGLPLRTRSSQVLAVAPLPCPKYMWNLTGTFQAGIVQASSQDGFRSMSVGGEVTVRDLRN